MDEKARSKLIEITSRAVTINETLLEDEKRFIKEAERSEDISSLKEMNERLRLLCRKEHLYLGAARSLLKIMASSSIT